MDYMKDPLKNEEQITQHMQLIMDRFYETPTDCVIITYDNVGNTAPMFIYPITDHEKDYSIFSITEINSKMLTRGEDEDILDISKIEIEELQDTLSRLMPHSGPLNHIYLEDSTILLLTSTAIAEMLEDYYIEKLTEKNQEMLEEYQIQFNAKWN